MVLGMFRVFGYIGPNLDQIWAWLPRGHRLAVGVRDPLKSSVTGPSLLVNCYLETKFHKKIRVTPPPPPPLNNQTLKSNIMTLLSPYTVPDIDHIGTNLFNIHHKIKIDRNPSNTTQDQASLTHRRSYIVNCVGMYICLSCAR